MDKKLHDYFSKIGRRGGKSKSEKKRLAAQRNAAKATAAREKNKNLTK